MGDAYGEALARGDLEAATFCAEDAEFVNLTTGRRVTGREAIKEALSEALGDEGAVVLDTDETDVRLVSSDVAIEEGISWPTGEQEGPPVRFVALYVKRGDHWRIYRVWQGDTTISSHFEHLRPLAWMIGEWNDKEGDTDVRNVCRWTKNRNFITRTFEVTKEGQRLNKGTEFIGWDASDECIRSWTFDTTGGFAASVWEKSGDKWHQNVVADLQPGDPTTRREALSSLAWMVGTWRAQMPRGEAETSCKWIGDGAFLVHRWSVVPTDDDSISGITVIGWNPVTDKVCSWMFDSDGGVADATWSQDGDAWLARSFHVLPDGRRGSSVTVYRKGGENELVWQRVSQELDGEMLPDESAVVVTRVAGPDAPKK